MRLFTFVGLLWVSSASAMGITQDESLFAWSSDGAAALLAVRAHGPEGGGSFAWRIIGPRSDQTFVVSSDFSPGGPTRPQRISGAACSKTLVSLQETLEALHFDKVETRPRGCKEKARDLTLRVTKAHSEGVHDSFSRTPPPIQGLAQGDAVRTAVASSLVLQFRQGVLLGWFVRQGEAWHASEIQNGN